MSQYTYQTKNTVLNNLLPNIDSDRLQKYAEYFTEKTANIKYQKRGVMPLEMFTVFVFCKELNITTLLESGTARGYSIELLASVLPDINLITVENFQRKYNYEMPTKERLAHLTNIQFITGDGSTVLLEHAKNLTTENLGVFIDGPKGTEAVNLATQLKQFDNVKFVSCHDLHSGLDYCPYSDFDFRQKYEYLNNDVYNLPINEAGGMTPKFEGEIIKNEWPNGYGIIFS